MNRESIDELERICGELFDLPESEHDAYLNKYCGEDSDLREEIESLLSFDRSDDGFLDSTPSETAAELISNGRGLVGRTVGRYEIKSLLGIGGMGQVFLAKDSKLGRAVAIKFLSSEYRANSRESKRFVKEARTVSALNHPNIVTVHEISEFEGTQFIAMEYIEGLTLREYRANGEPKLAECLNIGIQVASALKEAHTAGIIHRDIKSDNIMIRPNGLVKVLDFGIAKVAKRYESDTIRELQEVDQGNGSTTNPSKIAEDTPKSQLSRTSPGLLIGTASYMSPEQARGEKVDPQSDIFSLGVVLYELISGELPFSGKSPIETIGAVLFKKARSLTAFGVSEQLAQIVQRCLEKDTEDRYQSMNDLLLDLEKIEADEDELKVVAARSTPRENNARSVFGRFLIIPLIVIAALGLGTLLYQSYSPEESIDSIAILPFVNETGANSAGYLSDGITETLIRDLSSEAAISVSSRGTVFHYKGKQVSPKQVGQDLGVDAVLLGRIVNASDGVRLDVELTKTSGNDLLWSEQYSLEKSGLLAVQSQLGNDVYSAIRGSSSEKGNPSVTSLGTKDQDAFRLYLQGRFHWNKRKQSGYQNAVIFFQKAIDRDPKFALAYVGLADSIAFLNLSKEVDFRKAKALAQKAIELDPTLGEAHTTLGLIVHETEQNWKEAERQFQTAIDLNPNYATTHQWYAELLLQMGKTSKAISHFEKAVKIDPFSLPILTDRGFSYFYAGQSDRAIQLLLETKEKDPAFYRTYIYLAMIYEHEGDLGTAIKMYSKGLRLRDEGEQDVKSFSTRLTNVLGMDGKKGYWRERLALFQDYPSLRVGWDTELAHLYLKNGEEGKAFAEIEKLITRKAFDVFYLKVSPEFQEILNRRELKAILKRTNFPE